MKKNHLEVEALIRQAMAACKEDEAFSETKNLLLRALQAATIVCKKRGRNYATQEANQKAEESKKKGQKQWQNWWEMLQKNAIANLELPLDQEEEKDIINKIKKEKS